MVTKFLHYWAIIPKNSKPESETRNVHPGESKDQRGSLESLKCSPPPAAASSQDDCQSVEARRVSRGLGSSSVNLTAFHFIPEPAPKHNHTTTYVK